MILNLLDVDCSLDQSFYHRTTKTIGFHNPEFSGDIETNTLQDDEAASSWSEEIYEEKR